LCHDPKAPRIVEAVQVLREIAEVVVASGDDAGGVIARVDADLVVADEWIGTRDGRTLLAWACQTRASAVGILLASSQGGAAAARFDGLVVLPKLVDAATLKAVPATVAGAPVTYSTAVIAWRNKQVGILDEQLLFYSIKRSLA